VAFHRANWLDEAHVLYHSTILSIMTNEKRIQQVALERGIPSAGPYPWMRIANKVLGKLGVPVELHRRFDHHNEMVSAEQVVNFDLLMDEVLSRNITGDVVELGCYTGHTAAVLARMLHAHGDTRKLHVFDRFDIELGRVIGVREEFEERLRRVNVPMPIIHQGDVFGLTPEDLPSAIAFAHIDLGVGGEIALHERLVLHAMELVYPRLSKGGIIVLMDFHLPGVTVKGNDSNPGATKAATAFFADKPEKMRPLNGGPCSHGFVRKA
jgi:O-methyltransferase